MTGLRGAVALLLALLTPLLAAPAQARDTVRVALQLEPPGLDPTSGGALVAQEIVYPTVFEGLVRATADGGIVPLLATGWAVSPDGLHYDFRLRRDVRFHDGRPLTAADVVYSLRRIGAPGSTNAQAQAFANVRAITAPTADTARITLVARDSGFLTLLTRADAVIVPQGEVAQRATLPVGTGPFRFGDWRRGDRLTLLRNPAYWGRPARLARVDFRFIGDPSAAYAAIRAGDVDIFPDFPAPETLAQLRADARLKLVIRPSEGEVILALNQRHGPLADLRVRRAISHALDRQAIIAGAMYGYGRAIGSHFPPQSPDYVDLTGRYPFDPAAARALLAQAGYPDGFAVTLKLPPLSYARRTGEIVAAQLARVGIRVTIRNLEWPGWLDEVFARHDFAMTIVNHAEPFDYDIYARRDYYFGYDSAAFGTLMARLRVAATPAERHALLGEIQRRIAEDAANGFLFNFPHLGVQNRALADVWANTPNQMLDLAAAHIDGGEGGEAARGGGGIAWGGAVAAVVALGLLGLAMATLGAGYVLLHLTQMAATLVVATILISALVQWAPGDPASVMMGLNASPSVIAALKAELGLNGSFASRYLAWLAGMLHGDFGTSYTYRVPVVGLLRERLAVSLPLALLATLLSVGLGVGAGYLAASRRGTVAVAIVWLARIGVALPNFWLAILLVLLFAVRLPWFVAGGFPGWDAGIASALAALTLPVIALALPQAAILARVTYAGLRDEIGRDYVRTARAKGIGHRAAIRRHALPNALAPVLTVLGLQVPFLLGGSAIVENVFFLPGVGRLVLQAIGQRDLIVIQSVVVVLVAITILASFVVDIGYALADPRLRDGARG
ncbi:ABC transporter substrate-binding protein [Sphingomonas sp. M6A6_1c]